MTCTQNTSHVFFSYSLAGADCSLCPKEPWYHICRDLKSLQSQRAFRCNHITASWLYLITMMSILRYFCYHLLGKTWAMCIGKKGKMLLVFLVSIRGNEGLCLKYMPAGENSCKNTFHLLSECQSQNKAREIVDLLLRVHSTILISLLLDRKSVV